DFTRNNLCDSSLFLIYHVLKQNANIKFLILSENPKITKNGIKYLRRLIKDGHEFEAIELANTGIGDEGAIFLLRELCETKSRALWRLNLSNNGHTNSICPYIEKILSIYQLQDLLLSNNLIGNEGALFIEKGLSENNSLKLLDVSFNPISEEI